jgi:hypothetical protein
MASNDGERRMLFDIRGRRKNVVKVVYAILALLMGLSLFLVIGPAPLSDLFGTGASTTNAAQQFEDQAARLERELKKDPEDPQLLLNLTRAWTNAGNQLAVLNPETGESALTVEARAKLEKAGAAWERYVKATDEPSPSGAQLTAGTFFRLAQTSRTPTEIEANLKAAADAQQIVVDQRPSAGAVNALALYRYFSFEYPAAEKLTRQATKLATTKFERENLDNEAEETKARAQELQRQFAEIRKEAKAQGQGKETLENPLGGLGGGSSTLSE